MSTVSSLFESFVKDVAKEDPALVEAVLSGFALIESRFDIFKEQNPGIFDPHHQDEALRRLQMRGKKSDVPYSRGPRRPTAGNWLGEDILKVLNQWGKQMEFGDETLDIHPNPGFYASDDFRNFYYNVYAMVESHLRYNDPTYQRTRLADLDPAIIEQSRANLEDRLSKPYLKPYTVPPVNTDEFFIGRGKWKADYEKFMETGM